MTALHRAQAWAGLTLAALHTTREVVALNTGLPVGGTAGGQQRTLARLVVGVEAGDVLDIEGRQRVTNNIGPTRYTVGVGYWIDSYDVDDGAPSPDKLWTRLGSLNGDNVDKTRHHLPIHLHDVYQVPANWPAGHRITVVFRADAHSTAWQTNGGGDRLTVDDYGVLTVRRWASA